MYSERHNNNNNGIYLREITYTRWMRVIVYNGPNIKYVPEKKYNKFLSQVRKRQLKQGQSECGHMDVAMAGDGKSYTVYP